MLGNVRKHGLTQAHEIVENSYDVVTIGARGRRAASRHEGFLGAQSQKKRP
jgi:hypothetical protein